MLCVFFCGFSFDGFVSLFFFISFIFLYKVRKDGIIEVPMSQTSPKCQLLAMAIINISLTKYSQMIFFPGAGKVYFSFSFFSVLETISLGCVRLDHH